LYVRVNSTPPTACRSISRASTDLPLYMEGRDSFNQDIGEGNRKNNKVGIYPKCPSPDTDEEIEKAKLNSWIEFTKNQEMSVDKPTFLQRKRNSTRASSLAMDTLFEGYDEEDSFVKSDEINIIPSCTEYDGDWDSLEEQENMDFDLEEVDKAMRLTRPFNISTPIRRCLKSKIAIRQDPSTTKGQYGVPESKTVLRGGGGANSTTGDSENNQMETDSQNLTNKRNLVTLPNNSTPLNPSKVRKEQSPGTPKDDMEKACFHQRKARELTMYFEKFKTTTKKKLNASNNSELDKGVELLNDLVTELCLENMHYIGRYTELKRMYDELEDNRKRVGFASPLPLTTARRNIVKDNLTTDTETELTKKKRKPKNKKKRNTAATDEEGSISTVRCQAHTTDVDAPNSGTDASMTKVSTSSSRGKKEREKEILNKCREQTVPVKFIVNTEDKTTEETKKLLWTQVVSKNKTPKIKDSVVLSEGYLMITPADDKTRAAIESLANEGFGIQKTGAFLPNIIIYNVDKDIRSDELARTIIEQNPELGIDLSDKDKIQTRFKRGPKDKEIVH